MHLLKTLALAAAVLGQAAGVAAAESLPGPAFPSYRNAADIRNACDRGLAAARRSLQALERRPADAHWLAAYDDLNAQIEDASGPIELLVHVHPQAALRDAAQACSLRWSGFLSSLGQNAGLYRAAKQAPPADDIDREALRQTMEGFEDAGVGLAPKARQRAKRINDRISDLGQRFDRALRDDSTKLPFTEAELRGVPEAVWRKAPRDAQGRVLLGLEYPAYLPVMQTAEDAGARERMWRAKVNEGGDANLQRLAEITALRREYAKLFGHASYAEFVLRRRMAETPAQAGALLDQVQAAVEAAERRELQALREAKAQQLGRPADGVELSRWDVPFYAERLRQQRFSVEQEAFRRHFPPQASLAFALRVIEKMMGVRYTPVPTATLWHPDVHAYAVSDAASGRPLATLLVDLYPREGKYNHAAVFSFRNGAARASAHGRVPQAALVANLDRNGLTLDELETLLHELGHAVHNNLSTTRYAMNAGTSVERDFVEAPSQMLEDWVYDPRVMQVFLEVCPTCEPVPAERLAQARRARDHDRGVQFARQRLYAAYDLALHGADAADPMALWARMEGATPLGHVAGSKFPAGFSHVAGGYAAGYYGYLWSLVIAMDLRTAFAADRLDPAVGGRYRERILARGSERPPRELLRDFLGRDTSPQAFFEDLAKP